jgi:predicted nucleic acid-binding protein
LIVIDASAAVLALLGNGRARQQLRMNDLHAPGLIDSEVVSALRRHEHSGRISGGEASLVLDQWSRMGLRRYFVNPLAERIWQLRHNLTPYDAAYVALAENLGCSLLTADRGQAQAVGVRCPVLYAPS